MDVRKDKIEIADNLYYLIASSVMRQGMHCDALAWQLRKTLGPFLEEMAKIAYKDLTLRKEDGL